MPKCLHVVHVAVEIETDKISVLDGVIAGMLQAAKDAVMTKAQILNHLGTAKVEVIE